MADQVTIIITPPTTDAGSFDIYEYAYNGNGDPLPTPILLIAGVPLSSLISPGYTVTIDDFAYGISVVNNTDRNLGCSGSTVDHYFSSAVVTNNFLPNIGDLDITSAVFSSRSLNILLDQPAYTHILTGTTVTGTTSVGLTNYELSKSLPYKITVRDSNSVLPFIVTDVIPPNTGITVNIYNTILSPDRQFNITLDSNGMPSPSPSISVSASIAATPSVSATPNASPSLTPTPTPTITTTRSLTPSISITPSVTITRTPTKTPTPSVSYLAPGWQTVMITNTNGAYAISNVTINGIQVIDVSDGGFPVPPGMQKVGITYQTFPNSTVLVTLTNTSTGEHITVSPNCSATYGLDSVSFSGINTSGGVMIYYAAGLC